MKFLYNQLPATFLPTLSANSPGNASYKSNNCPNKLVGVSLPESVFTAFQIPLNLYLSKLLARLRLSADKYSLAAVSINTCTLPCAQLARPLAHALLVIPPICVRYANPIIVSAILSPLNILLPNIFIGVANSTGLFSSLYISAPI